MQPEITRRPAHSNSAVFRSYPRIARRPGRCRSGIIRPGVPQVDVAWGPIGGQQKETEKSLHSAEKGNSISLIMKKK
ncbi:hypothetical protein B0H11DRAFT_2184435, partial [Mycena galericulata]